jgi:hypothetical protein
MEKDSLPMVWSSPSSAQQTPLFLAALLYLLLPSTVVLLYFSAWPLVVAVLAGAAVFLARAKSGAALGWPPGLLSNTWPLLIMAAAIVWLSGAMPPFAENGDWYKHYAIFNALTQQTWPPHVATGDGIATLRYSIAYYVVPAAAVKLAGAAVLPFVIFAWSTLGLYLALVLAFGGTRRPAAGSFVLAGVFLFFSGADILGKYYTGVQLGPVMHLEWWWAPFGSLSAIVTNLIWTPQHAIAGLLSAFLVLHYPQQALRNAGVLGAAVAIWSPFAAIGLVPIVMWALMTAGWRHVLTVSNLVVAPGLLIIAALFLTSDAGGIPASWLAHKPGFSKRDWLVFVVLEFGALAVALWLAAPQRALLIGISAAFLFVLSLFHVGLYNDMLMRSSVPALGMLAWVAANVVAHAPNNWRKAPLIVLLVLGLPTPMGEIMRALVGTRMEQTERIEVDDLLRQDVQFAPQYTAGKQPLAEISATPVLDISKLQFSSYGTASFDIPQRRVSTAVAADAGLVSNQIVLPAGFYKVEATLDLDVSSVAPAPHAAHLSMHGKGLLASITTSTVTGQRVAVSMHSNGQPFQLSFGLGGWSYGKGTVQLKALTISAIDIGQP